MGMKKGFKSQETDVSYFSRVMIPIKVILLGISIYAFEGVGNQFRSKNELQEITIKEFLYFTNISLFYTVLCVFVGYLRNFAGTVKMLYTFMLATSFVLEAMVTLLFWVLYIIDPGLVKETVCTGQYFFSKYLNEFPKHLFPMIILFIEQRGIQIKKAWSHRCFLISFCLIYFLVVEVHYHITREYLYPLFNYLNLYFKFGLFSSLSFISIFIYEAWFSAKIIKPGRPRRTTKNK